MIYKFKIHLMRWLKEQILLVFLSIKEKRSQGFCFKFTDRTLFSTRLGRY